jgi:predicted aldo/keto reductase-like oxidoreductase
MAKCLSAAAMVGWVDVVTTLYNFRFIGDKAMDAALDECVKAGVGVLAMKTQALLSDADWIGKPAEAGAGEQKNLVEHFKQRGFSEQQAKIKVVLDDQRFSSVCVGMDSVATLKANVAVALGKIQLSAADRDALMNYASATYTGYCAGCGGFCEETLPFVSDVMRCLMYHRGYGDKKKARYHFSQIPASARAYLVTADYTVTERKCPRRMPIARLMAEAAATLA